MVRIVQRVGLLIVVGLVVTACGGDGGSSESSTTEPAASATTTAPTTTSAVSPRGPIDPCSLLTLEDLTALGISVGSGPTPQEAQSGALCTFGAVGDGLDPFVVTVYQPDEAPQLGDLPAGEALPDIEGYQVRFSSGLGVIQVFLEDGTVINLQVRADVEDVQGALVELAGIAARAAG